MNRTITKCDANAKCGVRRRPAFLSQIVPGIVGGVVSSMILYPLEVCETLMQGAAVKSDQKAKPNDSTCPTTPRGGTGTMVFEQPGVARLPPTIQVATAAFRKGQLFHGFDMALLSSMFGYTAFFGTFELTASLMTGTGPLWLLLRNLLAALASFVVNTPFQLVKTEVVLTGEDARTIVSALTQGGGKPANLWRGFVANTLGVAFIALQFTLFALFPAHGGVVEAALTGMGATALAAAVTYPVLTIRTAVMASDPDDANCFVRIARVARKMWREGTLYSGVATNAVRTVLPAFILFGLQSLLQG